MTQPQAGTETSYFWNNTRDFKIHCNNSTKSLYNQYQIKLIHLYLYTFIDYMYAEGGLETTNKG